jgi:hypothetical protein
MRHAVALAFVSLISFSWGCVENEDAKIAPSLVDAVQVSKSEPGPVCKALGALDGTSGDCDGSRYEAAYAAIRTRAALRGGNYVVIDHVMSDVDRMVTIEGRVYACAFSPYPTVQYNP